MASDSEDLHYKLCSAICTCCFLDVLLHLYRCIWGMYQYVIYKRIFIIIYCLWLLTLRIRHILVCTTVYTTIYTTVCMYTHVLLIFYWCVYVCIALYCILYTFILHHLLLKYFIFHTVWILCTILFANLQLPTRKDCFTLFLLFSLSNLSNISFIFSTINIGLCCHIITITISSYNFLLFHALFSTISTVNIC